MVLNRHSLHAVLIVLLGIAIVACSTKQTQSVVAVEGGSSVSMTKNAPAIVYTLIKQAQAEQTTANWPEALSLLNKAQRMAPNEAETYIQFGKLHSAMGNQKQAINMLKRALSLTQGQYFKQREIKSLLKRIEDKTD